jgi:hypothetical protein
MWASMLELNGPHIVPAKTVLTPPVHLQVPPTEAVR